MLEINPDLSGLAILVLEDDPPALRSMQKALETFGARVYSASRYEEAITLLSQQHIQVILAAIDFADEKIIGVIRDYKADYPESSFYILTEEGYDSVETSSEAVRLVVDDYIRKPLDSLRFAKMVETSTGRPSTGSTSLAVIEPLVAQTKPYFIFRSPAMRRALANISDIARSGQTVLISGETGTGKELVARAVHVLSSRSSGPFVPLNCGAIPESLIEGELFGHEKGAFTGAFRMRRGKFESANKGTLFLDEIGDMPINLQMRLLRVLEESKVYRIGAESAVHIDVRVIAATRVELEKAVADGLFREDLYYRLNILRIHLPPLRERPEDIPLLAVHFLERAFVEMGRRPPYPSLSSETIYLLERYAWRGNVRELRNIMTRIATLLPQGAQRIFPFHIQPYLEDAGGASTPVAPSQKQTGLFIPEGTPMARAEDLMIQDALRQTAGNRTRAARLLGISLRTLRRKLNER